MKYRILLKPVFLYLFITLFSLLLYLFFQLGIINSFLIQKKWFNILGFIHLIALLGFGFFGLYLSSQLKFKYTISAKNNKVIDENFIFYFLIFLNLIALWGLYKGILSNINVRFFSIKFWLELMANQYRNYIIWGKGYTILTNLFFVSLSFSLLLYNKFKKQKYILLIYFNIITIFLSTFAYSSRLKLILMIIIIFINNVRNNFYTKKINFFKIFLIVLLVVIFLVIGGGLRGIANAGIYSKWTDNTISWSVSIFTDYFVSTTLFSIRSLSNENSVTLSEVRNDLGPYEIRGYTNSGRYMHIYKVFGFYAGIFIFITHFFYGLIWKLFDKGGDIGILLYPYIVYFILEGFRIEALLVRDFQFILFCVIFIYFLFFSLPKSVT